MIRKLAVTSGLSLGLVLSLILERNVAGKHYATLVFVGVFALYWLVELIIDYVFFRKKYAKEYDIYKVQLLNSNTNLTMETIESGRKKYYKKFKRTKIKESIYKLAFILCSLGVFIADLFGFFI